MNLPVDRPCGLKLADVSSVEAARLVALHDELVRCVVAPRRHPAQLVELDLFDRNGSSVALMEKLSRAVLGNGVPSGVPRAFPHVVSNAKPTTTPKARPILRVARPYTPIGRG